MKIINQFKLVVLFAVVSLSSGSLFAFGSYAEGAVVAKIIQFESRGILFDSYEGIMEITKINRDEKCEEAKDACYTPVREKINFSVRPENAEIVNLLTKSINMEMLLEYRVHRITAIALSSSMEVINATAQQSGIPQGQGDKLVVDKSGSKRNFSVSGRIIQLDYQGTFIGTYEGIYFDEDRGKVHQFSITKEEMAKYALVAMKGLSKYNLGISVAFATGFRKSDYDMFEINYKEPAGGVNTAPTK
jgi:hypothetical protein